MTTRISQSEFYSQGAWITDALMALEKVTVTDVLTPHLVHLVKLRVSQLNQCCFCQHMHSGEARADGENQARLDVLPAWREAPCFSEHERVALAWAEALTLQTTTPIGDDLYQQSEQVLGKEALLELTALIAAINSWNRIGVGFGFVPEFE